MTGTGRLVRLALRRDRVLLPLWVLPLAVLPAGYAASFPVLFPTTAERLAYARLGAGNAGFVALYGPLHGAGLGDLVAWRSGFLPMVVALFSVLTVVRHTRAEEEAGRTELLGAAAVSRRAGLAAALIVAFGANAVLALVLAPGLIAQGLPVTGSVLLAAQFALSGWVFAAVAAVTAQLAGSARAARSLALVALAGAYVLRLAGDVSGLGSGAVSWLAWLSPIGWLQHTFPYADDVWWPLLPAVALSAVLIGVAGLLADRRDVGAGLLPARPGPAVGAASLRSPFALAWRLHRGPLTGWVIGFALLGLVFGGVAQSVAGLVEENPGLAEVFTRLGGSGGAVDSFLAGITGILGVLAAAGAVQAMLRVRDEESSGHAEVVLSTGVSRARWLSSHAVFAFGGPAVALITGGAVTGLVYGLAAGDVAGELAAVLGGALAQVPAVWVLAAVAAGLVGVRPRLAPVAWGAVGVCLLVLLAGATLGLSQWVLDVSPFTHVPHRLDGRAGVTPFVSLVLLAALLTAAGFAGLRRRDVPGA